MKKEIFLNSAERCCENGCRLLDEAQLLEFEKTLATRYYLAMIAQEEAAKAFLLYLVAVEAVPWTSFVRRATRDHQCKHLIGIILDYISPKIDDILQGKWRPEFPAKVADAMNLFRHEKLKRWESKNWLWAEDPEYDSDALMVAEGKRDRDKQRALYVEIGGNAEVASSPAQITNGQAADEYERGRRFCACVGGLLEARSGFAYDIEQVEKCFKALFSEPSVFIEPHITCSRIKSLS